MWDRVDFRFSPRDYSEQELVCVLRVRYSFACLPLDLHVPLVYKRRLPLHSASHPTHEARMITLRTARQAKEQTKTKQSTVGKHLRCPRAGAQRTPHCAVTPVYLNTSRHDVNNWPAGADRHSAPSCRHTLGGPPWDRGERCTKNGVTCLAFAPLIRVTAPLSVACCARRGEPQRTGVAPRWWYQRPPVALENTGENPKGHHIDQTQVLA